MPKRSNVNVKGKQVSIGNDVVGRDKINTTNNTTNNFEAPAPLALSLHQLPPPPPDFTGREAELKELLAHVETGALISGLRGQGGIGKTALALELAKRLTPSYPDAQFYLDLRGAGDQKPLTPAEALAHVIRAYHPTSKLPESETELRGLYLSILHEKRALLLMDNAKDAAQVTSLIPPATCYLLITSRQHFTLPGLFPKDLEQMPPDEARELLIKIAPRITPTPPSPIGDFTDGGGSGEGVADQIANLCGYLPLALRLTASALAERADLSPADLIRKLNDAKTRLKLTGVDASLQLSYDLLIPELQKLWRTLAVFPETFDRAAATAVWELEADTAHEALGELVKYSLLDFSPALTPTPNPPPSGKPPMGEGVLPSPIGELSDGGRGGDGGGRYHLHDLARLYADSRLSKSKRAAAQQRHAQHYEQVLRNARELYLQGDESIMRGLALFDFEQKNVEAGQKWAEANVKKNKVAAQLCSDYPDAGSYVLNLRKNPREYIRWLEAALVAARRIKRRDAEGVHLGNLASTYAQLGETRKAIEFYEQVLVIDHETGDRRGEGADLGNLGNIYYFLGETRKAIEFYEQALAIKCEISDRQGEGNTLINLGNAYAQLDEPRKAIEFFEQALVSKSEIGDRRGEGSALGNLGAAYNVLDEPRKAIEFSEQHLAIAREIGDQRGESNALGNLGVSYAHLGETHRAIKFYEQQLVITREISDRRSEGAALFNMSLALEKLGERANAIAHAEAALKICEQIEDPHAEMVRRQLEEWREAGG